jgi:lipid A 3-O-deacylase
MRASSSANAIAIAGRRASRLSIRSAIPADPLRLIRPRALLASPAKPVNFKLNFSFGISGIRAEIIVTTVLRSALAATLLTIALTGSATAQTKIVDELKLGVLDSDVGFLGHHVESGADINMEMLFTPPPVLRIIGSPRPMIGADISTDGKTSDGYFGLTWGIKLLQSLFGWGHGVFLNGGLGGAVNNGYIDSAPPGRKALGSPVLFHLSTELGVDLTSRTSISVFVDHMSNAGLAAHNPGITNAGARLGFKF